MSKIEVFTFGDPTPVLDGRDLGSYFESAWNGRWYEPPMPFDSLARILSAVSHHQSAITVKVNILSTCFRPHRMLDRAGFKRAALDFAVFGNAFFELQRNRLGTPWKLRPTLARYTRVARGDRFLMLSDGTEHWFDAGTIHHLMEPDINQEIYGLPQYTGAIQSALLSENATLFRRKYYINGSHAGFILYMTDQQQNQQDVDDLRKALKESKGPGNFRNLFMYSPGGKPDGIKVIPIAEVMAKDEFLNMKNITRDDIMAAHRVPPQLLGVMPVNTGGFGAADMAAKIFARNELEPVMATFRDVNDALGEEVIAFDHYVIEAAAAEMHKMHI